MLPILLGLGAVGGGLALFVASRPAKFKIVRERQIAAKPAAVYAKVADLHAWADWSPWEKLDPSMKKTFEGEPSGKGAIYAWDGNKKAGAGKMTITSAKEDAELVIRLEFIKPFAATNTTTFTFEPSGEGTRVTWAMEGENGFAGKAFSLLMNMDKTVGGDFEKGLAALADVAKA